jgi:hypothetical protein
MDTFAAWMKVCDWIAAIVTGGMMTDDFPDYDWRSSWEWGDHPAQAVRAAATREVS